MRGNKQPWPRLAHSTRDEREPQHRAPGQTRSGSPGHLRYLRRRPDGRRASPQRAAQANGDAERAISFSLNVAPRLSPELPELSTRSTAPLTIRRRGLPGAAALLDHSLPRRAMLLVGQDTATDVERLAGDIARVLRGEEGDEARDILRLLNAAERNTRDSLRFDRPLG